LCRLLTYMKFHQWASPWLGESACSKTSVDQIAGPLILLRNAPVLSVAAKNFAKLKSRTSRGY